MSKMKTTTLTVKVDLALAAEYKSAYIRTIGPSSRKRQSLAKFMTGFVEDRLIEEMKFLEDEAINDQ